MVEQDTELEAKFRRAALEAIQSYARGILSVDVLVEQMRQHWIEYEQQGAPPAPELLKRIAQRLCSQALCWAWQSRDPQVHECAGMNISRCLRAFLQHTSYAADLGYAEYALEEILQETLVDMQRGYRRESMSGPDNSAAFLKWTQTILVRHAHTYVEKMRRDRGKYLSLEAQTEPFLENDWFIDPRDHDPLDEVLIVELHQALKDAILSLRNQHYRDVLLYTYLVGLDEKEMSRLWGVQVQQIYLWRHRALEALRKNPALIRELYSLRE